jgi:hypothetical protein
MCRALTVLCVAADGTGLTALTMAAVSAEWELAAGATDEATALARIEAERPQVLVAFGPFEALIGVVAERFPGMRIVSDRDAPGATVVAASLEEVRDAVKRQPRPGGPVR